MTKNETKRYTLPRFLVCNARSLTNKIDELSTGIHSNKIDIAVVVESRLQADMSNDCFSILGYNSISKDRDRRRVGGICVYIRNDISYKYWIDLHQDNIECIWVTIHPKCMPRNTPNITIEAVYHPPKPTTGK